MRLPRQNGVIRLYLGGEIDFTAKPRISAELKEILGQLRPKGRLVVHLEETTVFPQDGSQIHTPVTTFCDENCVAMMVEMWKKLKMKECEMILVIRDRNVRKTFEMKGLDAVIKIVGDEGEIEGLELTA